MCREKLIVFLLYRSAGRWCQLAGTWLMQFSTPPPGNLRLRYYIRVTRKITHLVVLCPFGGRKQRPDAEQFQATITIIATTEAIANGSESVLLLILSGRDYVQF